MAVLMTLNNNGQAITRSKELADKGAVDAPSLAKLMAKETGQDGQERSFAQTFPTGTHAALALVGMDHAAQKRPHEISGGMKQRVGISRALAGAQPAGAVRRSAETVASMSATRLRRVYTAAFYF